MQIKARTKDEIKEYFDQSLSNDTSYTTASSEGESNAREAINAYQERVRGSPAPENDSDEEKTPVT